MRPILLLPSGDPGARGLQGLMEGSQRPTGVRSWGSSNVNYFKGHVVDIQRPVLELKSSIISEGNSIGYKVKPSMLHDFAE